MKAGAWGSKPGVGGPTDSSRVGDGAKRQPRDGMVPNMGARKPPNAGGGQRRGTSDSYQEELYTTKLDRSKITEEQARRAERIAREIEESSKSKNNRKFGEYEDRDDGDEAAPPQPAPPPPANNATTFPALGGGSAAPAPEPVKAQQPQSTQPPQSTAVDPAVLQMGPAANNAAPAQADKGQQEDRSGPPMTGGAPMNGPMQFLPGMQGRMMPAPGMAPPHAHMMQPGQAGMPGGWQGGSMNNQPPNAGMKNSGVAGGEGPSGMPSSDPMIMQQWQTQQAQQEMMMMRGQMHHMHNVIQTLTEDNNKLNTEKHHHYKTTDPNKDIRELEQKKGELHKEVLDLVGQKSNLEFMLMQMHHRMRLMGMHPGQMDKGSGVPMPGAPDYGMGMGGMPMDPMMMQQQQMQQMMMQQMMMQHMQGHASQGPQMQPQMQQGQPMPQSQPMPPPPQQQQPPPPQQQQQTNAAAPPPAANATPPADAQQAAPAPAPVSAKTTPPAETNAPPQTAVEQPAAPGAANALAAPSAATAAPQPAAPAVPAAHANGVSDAASWQAQAQAPPQQAPQPAAAAAPAAPQPQPRAKVSPGEAETLQNLKRQLLHLKKTTDHREYFDLDNMTMQQLESTIKRVQEANGIPTNSERGQRGRGRSNNEPTNTGVRPGDDWEVVGSTKKSGMAKKPTDDKKIKTFQGKDQHGVMPNICEGLTMFCDFITPQEETQLVSFVNDQVAKGARRELAGNTYNKAKHMTAQLHYGVFYNIAENSLGGKTVEPVPDELNRLITKLTNEGVLYSHQRPNTALVSVMEEGDGMLPHVDSKEFARPICTLSLLADHEMLFGDKSGQIDAHGIGNMAGHAENIPRRSVIRLDDLVANDVQHAINPSKSRRIIITLRQQIPRSRSQGMGR